MNVGPCYRSLCPDPLTPAISPSEGEREHGRWLLVFSLAPSEGERAGVRGKLATAPGCLA
jgi:hypothetical protein